MVRSAQREKRNQSAVDQIPGQFNTIQPTTVQNSRTSTSNPRHQHKPADHGIVNPNDIPMMGRKQLQANPNAANGGVGISFSNVVL